jgi:hypothetical protein
MSIIAWHAPLIAKTTANVVVSREPRSTTAGLL